MSQYPPPPGEGPGQESGQQPDHAWTRPTGTPGGAATGEERNWALVAHLGALVTAWFAFGFIAPLLTLLLKGNTSPFVRRHSVASLNFQLSMLIYAVVATILMLILTLVTFGLALVLIIPLLGVVLLVLLTFVIIGSVRAMAGEEYTYPFALPLIT